MKHEINKMLLMAAAIISMLTSCVKDTLSEGSQVSSEGEVATVRIGAGTRADGEGDYLDNNIISLRIITFGAGEAVTSNTFYDAVALDVDPDATSATVPQAITHQMKSGIHDFVFIANENNGSEQPALKTDVKKKSDLNNVSLSANLFNQTDVIPMLAEINNVTVLPGSQGIRINNGTVQNSWVVVMKRLGIRIDMALRAKVDIGDRITSIKFLNLPTAVPLRGNYTTTTFAPITRTAEEVIKPLPVDELQGYVWGRMVTRVILPSHMFADITNADKAMKMVLTMGSENPSATIGYDEPDDYTLPPNVNFIGEGVIGPLLALNLTPVVWDPQSIDGSITGRTLNVSALKKYVIVDTEGISSKERIYFNSNQKNVTIDITGTENFSWYSDINVNDIFDKIAGTAESETFHYEYDAAKGTGTGYVDLRVYDKTVSGGFYSIYLNAGGLRRELKVAVMKTNFVQITDYAYVGTFHRWNETDERLITIPAIGSTPVELQGDWVAIVGNEYGKEWIRLDTETFGSNGGRISTGAVTAVDGLSFGDPIKFRVGLTGTHPAGSPDMGYNAQPRYSVIHLYYGTTLDKVHRIYVRQGEAADFLMRNEDEVTSGPLAGTTRTEAQKISPYNLTDPEGRSGRVGSETMAYQIWNGTKWVNNEDRVDYTFTEYPSQAGYFFQWYQAYAWSPVGNSTYNWLSANSSTESWNNWAWEWDTCPWGYGYRRPNDGPTNQVYYTSSFAYNSELRQSLYLNPPDGTSSNSNSVNSVWGYLADGFFDQGVIDANGAVNSGTTNVAYIGRLFYNTNTNASVFLPAAGIRNDTGVLNGAGSTGYYSSSTSYSEANAWIMNFSSSFLYQASINRNAGFSIRCVMPEPRIE